MIALYIQISSVHSDSSHLARQIRTPPEMPFARAELANGRSVGCRVECYTVHPLTRVGEDVYTRTARNEIRTVLREGTTTDASLNLLHSAIQ